MSEIKFTEEELQSLSDLSTNYQNIQSSFGQLRVQKILNQKTALERSIQNNKIATNEFNNKDPKLN